MADITQQIAQGIDITTPLLQGLALKRQGEQDALANQQAVAQQQQKELETKATALSKQQDFQLKIGDRAGAVRTQGQINGLLKMPFDEKKMLTKLEEDSKRFISFKSQMAKVKQGGNPQEIEAGATVGNQILQEFTFPDDPPGGVSASPEVTGLAEQIRADAPQPAAQPVQPQAQPQITTQQNISRLRDIREGVASLPETPESKAFLKRIDDEVGSLEKQIPKATAGGEASTKTINAIHLAQTGKSFSEGTQETQQNALDEQQRRAVDVSAARAETKLGIEVKKDIAALDNTNVIVDTLDRLSSSIIKATTAGGALKQRVRLSAGALTKANETAATFNDQKEQFTGVLSRSLGGEKGVLTDRDISRITKGLPGFGDTKKIRDFKMGTIKLLIDTAIESKRRLLSNQPQNPNINRRLNELFRDLESNQGLEKHLR